MSTCGVVVVVVALVAWVVGLARPGTAPACLAALARGRAMPDLPPQASCCERGAARSLTLSASAPAGRRRRHSLTGEAGPGQPPPRLGLGSGAVCASPRQAQKQRKKRRWFRRYPQHARLTYPVRAGSVEVCGIILKSRPTYLSPTANPPSRLEPRETL